MFTRAAIIFRALLLLWVLCHLQNIDRLIFSRFTFRPSKFKTLEIYHTSYILALSTHDLLNIPISCYNCPLLLFIFTSSSFSLSSPPPHPSFSSSSSSSSTAAAGSLPPPLPSSPSPPSPSSPLPKQWCILYGLDIVGLL